MSISPDKAPYGTPCNGCGLCCMSEPCALGRALFTKQEGRCPALEWHDDHARYSCGLVTRPERYATPRQLEQFGSRPLSEAASLTVGVGTGCDSEVQGERVGRIKRWLFHRKMRRLGRQHARLRVGAIATWLGGEKTAEWLADVMGEERT